ncbi:MAG TPA: hypothetical protein GX399_03035 [Xanthomonadaceae bacterium]|nr:hypothetical protein [Xanthomonadaceae bacterium]
MNDATEFESSLAGAIGFFQNLRRKLGALEVETGVQHEQLRAIATSVATLQQERQTDQRTFVTLASDVEAQAGQLVNLRSDARLLDEQLTQLETLAACLQQDQQQMRQSLATLMGDLRTRSAALRQELEAILEEQLAGQNRQLHDLLDSLKIQSQDAGQTRQDLQQQQERLKHLETLLGKVAADASSTRQILNVLQTDLTTQSDTLRELDQTWRDGLAAYQDRLSHLETTVAGAGRQSSFSANGANPTAATLEPPLPTAISSEAIETLPALPSSERERLDKLATLVATAREEQWELRQELATVQTALASQAERLADLRGLLAEQLQTQQQRLCDLETALDTLRQAPAPATEADLLPLHDALTTQTGILDELQRSMRQQLHAQHLRLDELEAAVGNLSQAPTPTQEPVPPALIIEQQHPRVEPDDSHAQELQQNLDVLQEAVAALETRLTSQAQAFSGNFAQFQGLDAAIRELQQQLAKPQSPQQSSVLEQRLAAQQQEIAQLQDAVQQLQIDSQQIDDAVRQDSHDLKIAALAARLNEQQEQLTDLSTAVEAIRTDSRATQEKVLTMAANVAQRIHEFQNQLLAAKTAQGEHLQEVEQKLILLQAAVETLETQRKPRRWFSTPAMFTTLAFTAGAALLAALAQVIWTVG